MDALVSVVDRANPATVPMPMFYERDRETEDEARVIWDIEESPGSLTELEVVNLTGHWDNRARFRM